MKSLGKLSQSGGPNSEAMGRVLYRRLSFLGFPKYRVGSDGSVWAKRKYKGHAFCPHWKKLKPFPHRDGHLFIDLHHGENRGRVRFFVHHLVLIAFVSNRPRGCMARHYPDPDPTNNRLANLSWTTPLQNQKDRNEHGTGPKRTYVASFGVQNGKTFFSEEQVREIRKLHAAGKYSYRELAVMFGASKPCIGGIVSRKTWKRLV